MNSVNLLVNNVIKVLVISVKMDSLKILKDCVSKNALLDFLHFLLTKLALIVMPRVKVVLKGTKKHATLAHLVNFCYKIHALPPALQDILPIIKHLYAKSVTQAA